LAHLAEALGTPAKVIFGPTTPDLGFGPWKKESQSIGYSLWCRPCGKDGRYCIQWTKRYRCLKELSPEVVFDQILKELKE
jgi:heptosyltransferase-2